MKFNQNLIRAYERRRMQDKEQKEKIARQSREGKAEEEKTRLPDRRNYDSGGGQGRNEKDALTKQTRIVNLSTSSKAVNRERERETEIGGRGAEKKNKFNSIFDTGHTPTRSRAEAR